MSVAPLARPDGGDAVETIEVKLPLKGLVVSLAEAHFRDGPHKPNLVMNFEPFPTW